MASKRIIVLANSYKKMPGRCVAGRELRENDIVGGWIRPISDQQEGELLPQHIQVDDGKPLEVLDVVDIPIGTHANDPAHPEDWYILSDEKWKRKLKFTAAELASLEEIPVDLWLESEKYNHRVSPEFLQKRKDHQSIYLIRPVSFRVEMTNDYNPWKDRNETERRACFKYKGRDFSLTVTDPVFIEKHAKTFPLPNKPAIVINPANNYLICVSLTPPYKLTGYHYKVVATIFELP